MCAHTHSCSIKQWVRINLSLCKTAVMFPQLQLFSKLGTIMFFTPLFFQPCRRSQRVREWGENLWVCPVFSQFSPPLTFSFCFMSFGWGCLEKIFSLVELGNKPNNESKVNKSPKKKKYLDLDQDFLRTSGVSRATVMDSPVGKRQKIIPDMLTFLWPGAFQFPPLTENILENWG